MLAGCGGPEPVGEPVSAETVTLSAPGVEVTLSVEIADSAGERARGLSGRRQLAEGSGMLFVNREQVTTAFWMKDTLIPLSIAFAGADGVIDSIVDMAPCVADPCPTYAPDQPYRLALEVRRGAFAEWGIGPGARIVREAP